MMDVVIPVKDLSQAKGRLREVLTPDQRSGLVLAMLRDLLSGLRQCDLGDVWLVARDDAVFDLGAEYATRAIREPRSEGYNQGVALGMRAIGAGRAVLVLPADLPLTEADDIACLAALRRSNRPVVGIVPDRHHRGTNGLFLSASDLIAPAFGINSLVAHKVAATRAGITPKVLALDTMAQDIDTVQDLTDFMDCAGPGATTTFLRSIGFGQARVRPQQQGAA